MTSDHLVGRLKRNKSKVRISNGKFKQVYLDLSEIQKGINSKKPFASSESVMESELSTWVVC